MMTISKNSNEYKRLGRKLNLALTLLETADIYEQPVLLQQIIKMEQKLGIESKREVKEMKQPVKKQHLPYTKEQIVSDLNSGLSQVEVAEKYRLSEGYVSKFKQRHIGVRYKVGGNYQVKLTPPDLARLLNEGRSLTDIAVMYHMSIRGVSLMKEKYIAKEFYTKEG